MHKEPQAKALCPTDTNAEAMTSSSERNRYASKTDGLTIEEIRRKLVEDWTAAEERDWSKEREAYRKQLQLKREKANTPADAEAAFSAIDADDISGECMQLTRMNKEKEIEDLKRQVYDSLTKINNFTGEEAEERIEFYSDDFPQFLEENWSPNAIAMGIAMNLL